MGRYRQWLCHQEIEQQFHTRLQYLETELLHWQEQARMYDDARKTLTDNQLYIALTTSMHTNTLPTVSSAISDRHSLFSLIQHYPLSMTEPIAPPEQPSPESEPFTGKEGGLQFISQTTIANTPHEEVPSSQPHAELALQPEDMMPYFDGQSPTELPRELPHWLHTLIETSLQNNQKTGMMNEEALRSNRLFQRWFERWGLPSEAPSAESGTVKRHTLRKEGEL